MSDNGNTPKPQNFRRYDHRHHCGRLLFRAYLGPGTVLDVRCPKCSGVYRYLVGDNGGKGELVGKSREEE